MAVGQCLYCIARVYSGIYFSFWLNDIAEIKKLRKLKCKGNFITVLSCVALIYSFITGINLVANILLALIFVYFSFFTR